MFKKIKALTMAFFICLSAVCFSSCGTKSGDTDEVYFLNFKPEAADTYNKIADAYEKETGVKVRVVTAAANTYEQTLKSEIAKSNPPTIFTVNGPVGYESWKNYCADLTGSKLYSYLTDKSLAITDNGRVYGIPFVVEGYGIIYNNEILTRYFALKDKAVDISSAEEIKNFDTLKAVVEDMTKHKAELKIDGVFGSTSLSSGEEWRWQTHLSNVAISAEFDDDDDIVLEMLEEDDIDFKYAENFRKIFDLYINNSITDKKLLGSKSVADSMAEFALGKVAMIQNGTWSFSQIKGVTGNTVKEEDIKFLPIYMGLEGEEQQGLCVGTENYIAINAKASDGAKKASFEFLDWLYSSPEGKKFVTDELGFITPFNTFSSDEAPDDPLSRQVKLWLNKQNVKSIPWAFTAYPGENFKNDFAGALLQYVQGKIEFSKVVETVKNSWKEERK